MITAKHFTSALVVLTLSCGGPNPDQNVKQVVTLAPVAGPLSDSDAQLVEWVKTATDEEVAMWIGEIRTSEVPPDFVPPEWLTSAADLRSARAAIEARYGDFKKRMSDPVERLRAAREDPLMIRYMVWLTKSTNSG